MKIKDRYIQNNAERLMYDIKFYNEKLYPKKPITLQEVLTEVTNQFNKHKIV